jgi:hypothetical protein
MAKRTSGGDANETPEIAPPTAEAQSPATDATAVNATPLSAEDSSYVQAIALKQGRLAGEERASLENVPGDQRPDYVAAIVNGALAAAAALPPDQLQALHQAGREGRLADCRGFLGLS